MVMRMRPWFFAVAAIVLLLAGAVANGAEPDFSVRIRTDLESGRIDRDTALLYGIYYGFDPDRLPERYRPESFQPLKDATRIIWEYQRRRDRLPPETVRIVDAYLEPAAAAKASFVSPLGHFQLSYTTSGADAVPGTDADGDGVPDYVENCADYLDTAWETEINTLGFAAPPASPYYQISFESMDYYGYTTVVSGAATRIVLHNTFQGFPSNDDPEGNQWGAAKVTCAHEFKHASQRAQSNWSEGGWVELDATWMEDIVFDVVNDYYNYLPSGSPISNPELALDAGGSGSYEDCVWQHWMSETWGAGIVTDFWTHRATHTGEAVIVSYDTILQSYGSSLAVGFPVFAAWNYATGVHAAAGFGYGESADYPTAPAIPVNAYPAALSGTLSNLAADFHHCYGFGGESGTLDIDFNGQDGETLGLAAVIRKTDGTTAFETIVLDAANDADVSLGVPLEQMQSVGLVVSNAAPVGSAVYTLDVDASVVLPRPAAQVSASSVAVTLLPDSLVYETVDLQNVGEPGSVLEYAVLVMENAPSPAAQARLAGTFPDDPNAGRDPLTRDTELRSGPVAGSLRYAGDCRFGNSDIENVQGYYGDWWWGNERYAYFISPDAEPCACTPGFNVRAVHMLLYLTPASSPQVRVHLAAVTGGVRPAPGAILASSQPMTVSGIVEAGYHDIEVACDFECADTAEDYFLVFEFLDADGPVGIPIGMTAGSCMNYNDWGSGYKDLVDGYGFLGDLFIWADVDCCGEPLPEVSVLAPNGGEAFSVGATVDLAWSATVVDSVKVELSRDGGGAWETLFEQTENDGLETWTITGPVADDCLLRVATPDGAYGDVSDAPFMIFEPSNWLAVIPETGSLAQGETQPMIFGFDSTGMSPGDYQSYVVISHNGDDSPIVLPVIFTVADPSSGVGAPARLTMSGNVPNPFNPSTRIRFTLPEAAGATVEIVDLQGRVVRTLYRGRLEAGPQSLQWDGRDADGRMAASGAYLARVRSGGRDVVRKMLLAK